MKSVLVFCTLAVACELTSANVVDRPADLEVGLLDRLLAELTKRSDQDTDYGVLLDAGSTSTKLKVYTSTPSDTSGLPALGAQELPDGSKDKFKPGLSDFLGDKTKIDDYLRGIVDVAKTAVPADKHSQTPIFLFATAGMRYLNADDALFVMDAVRAFLSDAKNSPFRFVDTNAQIISGEEEATYLWVAANYAAGFFNHDSQADSVGVIEIGGGSMQIAFMPQVPLYGEEFHVTVGGRPYQLYAESYFNFGANGIKAQLLNWFDKYGNKDEGDFVNPCMLEGDVAKYTLDSGKEVNVLGSSAPEECLAAIKDLVDPYTGHACQLKPCAVGPVYQPRLPALDFMAIGGSIKFTLLDLNVDGEPHLNIANLNDTVHKFCRKTVDQVDAEGKIPRKFASNNCVMGLYIPEVLTSSFGFPEDSAKVIASNKINGNKFNWAQGAMLINMNAHITGSDNFSVRRKRSTA